MGKFLSFIVSFAVFGALLVLMDFVLLRAQGLSFIFRG